jgi:hypothetical protein
MPRLADSDVGAAYGFARSIVGSRTEAELRQLSWELFLSLHAVRERLARLEAKLEVRTAGAAVTPALRESL